MFALVVLAAGVVASASTAASATAAGAAAAVGGQRDQSQAAIDRCERELEFRMGREIGGRTPDAIVDARRARVSRASNRETAVSGTGRYTRDGSDRGRAFTFECTYDTRDDEARATYQWSEGDEDGRRPGGDYRPGDRDRPGDGRPSGNRPGFGIGGSRPEGNVWASGGILVRHSGKALDVQNRAMGDGVPIQQWAFADATNQRWDFIEVGRGEYAIVSQSSAKVLDVENNSDSDGATIVQNRWRSIDSQRWRLERANAGYYQIVNVRSNKCLDVSNQSRDDGAKVQQWTCSGNAANQAWRVGRP